MSDDLFSIKNEFYLGNYQGAINEAQSSDLVLSTAADERDRDVIVSIHELSWPNVPKGFARIVPLPLRQTRKIEA